MTDTPTTRNRVRRPAPEVAEQEDIVTEEPEVAVPEEEPSAPKVTLHGPFTYKGLHIIDARGRKIALAGISGDVARTGNGIAEALVALLNR